jgi:hypothetical protein
LPGLVVAWFVTPPARLAAAVMAFGSGVLVSALFLELMEEPAGKAQAGWLAGAPEQPARVDLGRYAPAFVQRCPREERRADAKGRAWPAA